MSDPAKPAKPAHAGTPTLRDLRGLTQARIALGAHGAGLPTGAALAFGLDHARAREAVWTPLDAAAIRAALRAQGLAGGQVEIEEGGPLDPPLGPPRKPLGPWVPKSSGAVGLHG